MLSVAQREAIRRLALDDDVIHTNTLFALERRGLVRPPNFDTSLWQLTEAGWREHERIMATGDGPEALKQLLRF